MRRPTVVLGLGNPLMADEGIGVVLIARLAERADRYPSVDFIDAATGGLAVLHHIEGRDRAIIIDCALMGEPPGTIRRFRPDQVRSTKVLAHHSLHEADLIHVLGLARQLGQKPREIVIFGIQPQVVEPAYGLSATLTSRIHEYVALILEDLQTCASPDTDDLSDGRIS